MRRSHRSAGQRGRQPDRGGGRDTGDTGSRNHEGAGSADEAEAASRARRQRRILAGVSATAFLGPFTQTVYAPSLADVGTDLQVGTLLVNLTISVYSIIFALSGFVWGPFGDSRGRRTALLTGLALFLAGSVLCLLASSYAWFLAGRIVQAGGISAGSVIAAAVIGDVYRPRDRAHAMSIYQLVVFLGPVCGPVIGGFVAGHLHWQWAFGLLVLAGVAVLVYDHRRLPETLHRPDDSPGWTSARMRAVAGSRTARAMFFLGFGQFYGYYVFLVFVPALVTPFGLSTARTGLMFVPLTAGIFVGIVAARRWFPHWVPARIIGTSAWVTAATVLLLWSLLAVDRLSPVLLAAVLAGYGLTFGASLPAQSTLLVTVFSTDRATAMGMYNFARFTGAAAGPLLGAVVADRYGIPALCGSLGLFLLLAARSVSTGLPVDDEADTA